MASELPALATVTDVQSNTVIFCTLAVTYRESCTQVQEEMVDEVWSDDLMQLAACRPEHGSSNQMLFTGPRVKMGIYEGVPVRVVPVRSLLRFELHRVNLIIDVPNDAGNLSCLLE